MKAEKRLEFVTFHQSFGYEDFIEGLKASTDDRGRISYKVENGIFKEICRRADQSEQIDGEAPPYVLIIDEINRGNISAIFGELITLIERSKRAGEHDALEVHLPYSKQLFSVPGNLYIIGTMNTADRSIALLDTALRRRFRFEEVMPDLSLLVDLTIEGVEISKMLAAMNKRIEALHDRDHQLGQPYFLPLKRENAVIAELAQIFRYEILPLLQEYFYDDREKIDRVVNKNGFLRSERPPGSRTQLSPDGG